jgi:hypothetical protein
LKIAAVQKVTPKRFFSLLSSLAISYFTSAVFLLILLLPVFCVPRQVSCTFLQAILRPEHGFGSSSTVQSAISATIDDIDDANVTKRSRYDIVIMATTTATILAMATISTMAADATMSTAAANIAFTTNGTSQRGSKPTAFATKRDIDAGIW